MNYMEHLSAIRQGIDLPIIITQEQEELIKMTTTPPVQ